MGLVRCVRGQLSRVQNPGVLTELKNSLGRTFASAADPVQGMCRYFSWYIGHCIHCAMAILVYLNSTTVGRRTTLFVPWNGDSQ